MRVGTSKRPADQAAPAPKQHVVFDEDDMHSLTSEDDVDDGSDDHDEDENEDEDNDVEDEDDDEDDDDDDSEVEELTMSATREQARLQASAAQAQRSREKASRSAAQARRQAQSSKSSRGAQKHKQMNWDDDEDDIENDDDEDDEEVSDSLDPALFAAAFAKQGDAAAREVLRSTASASSQRPKRIHGLARGWDGRPMTRVPGERVIVRALDPADEVADDVDDAPWQHTPLDPHRSLPSARMRAYKKQKLGLRAKDVRTSTLEKPPRRKRRSKAPVKDEDDPLSLQDPAFLPGGEFALTGKKRRTTSTTAPTSQGRTALAMRDRGAGGRVPVPTSRTMGPAAVFARSRRG